jgi:hypothetical protein
VVTIEGCQGLLLAEGKWNNTENMHVKSCACLETAPQMLNKAFENVCWARRREIRVSSQFVGSGVLALNLRFKCLKRLLKTFAGHGAGKFECHHNSLRVVCLP